MLEKRDKFKKIEKATQSENKRSAACNDHTLKFPSHVWHVVHTCKS